MPDLYAWTNIRSGGDVDVVTDPLGRQRKVVSKRNVIAAGSKVSEKDFEGGKEELEEKVAAGAVRSYPMPKDYDTKSTESVVDFLRRSLREAAEAQVSEEQQLLYATGQGGVLTSEGLVEAQPTNVDEVQKAAGTK